MAVKSGMKKEATQAVRNEMLDFLNEIKSLSSGSDSSTKTNNLSSKEAVKEIKKAADAYEDLGSEAHKAKKEVDKLNESISKTNKKSSNKSFEIAKLSGLAHNLSIYSKRGLQNYFNEDQADVIEKITKAMDEYNKAIKDGDKAGSDKAASNLVRQANAYEALFNVFSTRKDNPFKALSEMNKEADELWKTLQKTTKKDKFTVENFESLFKIMKQVPLENRSDEMFAKYFPKIKEHYETSDVSNKPILDADKIINTEIVKQRIKEIKKELSSFTKNIQEDNLRTSVKVLKSMKSPNLKGVDFDAIQYDDLKITEDEINSIINLLNEKEKGYFALEEVIKRINQEDSFYDTHRNDAKEAYRNITELIKLYEYSKKPIPNNFLEYLNEFKWRIDDIYTKTSDTDIIPEDIENDGINNALDTLIRGYKQINEIQKVSKAQRDELEEYFKNEIPSLQNIEIPKDANGNELVKNTYQYIEVMRELKTVLSVPITNDTDKKELNQLLSRIYNIKNEFKNGYGDFGNEEILDDIKRQYDEVADKIKKAKNGELVQQQAINQELKETVAAEEKVAEIATKKKRGKSSKKTEQPPDQTKLSSGVEESKTIDKTTQSLTKQKKITDDNCTSLLEFIKLCQEEARVLGETNEELKERAGYFNGEKISGKVSVGTHYSGNHDKSDITGADTDLHSHFSKYASFSETDLQNMKSKLKNFMVMGTDELTHLNLDGLSDEILQTIWMQYSTLIKDYTAQFAKSLSIKDNLDSNFTEDINAHIEKLLEESIEYAFHETDNDYEYDEYDKFIENGIEKLSKMIMDGASVDDLKQYVENNKNEFLNFSTIDNDIESFYNSFIKAFDGFLGNILLEYDGVNPNKMLSTKEYNIGRNDILKSVLDSTGVGSDRLSTINISNIEQSYSSILKLLGLVSQKQDEVSKKAQSSKSDTSNGTKITKEISDIEKLNQLFQEMTPIVSEYEENIKKSVDDLSRYNSLDFKAISRIFEDIQNGSLKANDNIINLLKSLKILSNDGKIIGNIISNDNSGNSLGGIISEKYSIIARKLDEDNLVDKAFNQNNSSQIISAGGKIANIVGYIEDKTNNILYDIQETVSGKTLLEAEDILHATDDQLKSLLLTIDAIAKSGGYVDDNLNNFLFNSKNGFTAIDLGVNRDGFDYSSEDYARMIAIMLGDIDDELRKRFEKIISQYDFSNSIDQLIQNSSLGATQQQIKQNEQLAESEEKVAKAKEHRYNVSKNAPSVVSATKQVTQPTTLPQVDVTEQQLQPLLTKSEASKKLILELGISSKEAGQLIDTNFEKIKNRFNITEEALKSLIKTQLQYRNNAQKYDEDIYTSYTPDLETLKKVREEIEQISYNRYRQAIPNLTKEESIYGYTASDNDVAKVHTILTYTERINELSAEKPIKGYVPTDDEIKKIHDYLQTIGKIVSQVGEVGDKENGWSYLLKLQDGQFRNASVTWDKNSNSFKTFYSDVSTSFEKIEGKIKTLTGELSKYKTDLARTLASPIGAKFDSSSIESSISRTEQDIKYFFTLLKGYATDKIYEYSIGDFDKFVSELTEYQQKLEDTKNNTLSKQSARQELADEKKAVADAKKEAKELADTNTYLAESMQKVKDLQLDYLGKTNHKPIVDAMRLLELDYDRKDILEEITKYQRKGTVLESNEIDKLNQMINDLKSKVKVFKNIEYAPTDLAAKNFDVNKRGAQSDYARLIYDVEKAGNKGANVSNLLNELKVVKQSLESIEDAPALKEQTDKLSAFRKELNELKAEARNNDEIIAQQNKVRKAQEDAAKKAANERIAQEKKVKTETDKILSEQLESLNKIRKLKAEKSLLDPNENKGEIEGLKEELKLAKSTYLENQKKLAQYNNFTISEEHLLKLSKARAEFNAKNATMIGKENDKREKERNRYLQIGAEKLAEQKRKEQERLAQEAEKQRMADEKAVRDNYTVLRRDVYQSIGERSPELTEMAEFYKEQERLAQEQAKVQEKYNQDWEAAIIENEKRAKQLLVDYKKANDDYNKYQIAKAGNRTDKVQDTKAVALKEKMLELEQKIKHEQQNELLIDKDSLDTLGMIQKLRAATANTVAMINKDKDSKSLANPTDLKKAENDYATLIAQMKAFGSTTGDAVKEAEKISELFSIATTKGDLTYLTEQLKVIRSKFAKIKAESKLTVDTNVTDEISEVEKAYNTLAINTVKIAKIKGDDVSKQTKGQLILLDILEKQNNVAKDTIENNKEALSVSEEEAKVKYENALLEAESYKKSAISTTVKQLQDTSTFDVQIQQLNNAKTQTEYYKQSLEKLSKQYEEYCKLVNGLSPNNITQKQLLEAKQAADALSKSIKNLNKPINPTAISNLTLKTTKWIDNNTRISEKSKNELEDLVDQMKQISSHGELQDIAKQINDIETAEIRAGHAGKSFGDLLKKSFQSMSRYLLTFASFYRVVGIIRNGINTVRELDTALIDLRKTTKMSNSELKEFYYSSNDIAIQMGVTTKEIINQASAFSRLGYSSKEAATMMSELSSQFASISPDMDVSTATDGLVSIMKAFEISTADVERKILDNVNIIGNTAATSNGEIVDMLMRSSAAMKEANNTLEETIALETAAIEITRNAETTGTAFKTISMRIRGKRILPPYTVMCMLCIHKIHR